MLKLLESPYDPVFQHTEAKGDNGEKPLQGGEEMEGTTAMKSECLNSEQQLSSYFSKPPEWAISLCVT